MSNVASLADRKILQYQMLLTLHNQHEGLVKQRLAEILKPDVFKIYQRYIDPTRNPLKRIAEILSVTYNHPPRRYIRNKMKNKKLGRVLKRSLRNLDRVLIEVEKQVNSVGDVFVIPYFDEQSKKIDFELIPAYLVDVKYDRATPISYTVTYVDNERKDIYFSDGSYQRNGEKRRKGLFNRFVPIRFSKGFTDSLLDWAVYDNLDILKATLKIGILETYDARVDYLRSFRQPKASADELSSATGISNGDNAPIDLAPDSLIPFNIDTIELADPSDQLLKTIKTLETDISASRGISSSVYYMDSNAVQNDTITAELRSYWSKGIKIMKDSEKLLLLNALDIYLNETQRSISGLSVDDIIIDYIEPIPELNNPLTAQRILSNDIKLGTDNVVSYLLRTNPDFETEEEALAQIQNNINIRALMVEKMRELNMPADVLNDGDGKSPEINGGDNNFKQNNTLNSSD